MSKQHHYLKTVNPYFMDVYNGLKNFEVRFNDRDFKVGDTLHLQEYIPEISTTTGREIRAEVIYLLDNPQYCKDGYVILGIEVYAQNFYEDENND